MLCLFRIGRTEHEDTLARQQEGVHVGNADVGLGKECQHAGCLAWLVFELDGKDIGDGCRDALFFQHDKGTLWVITDDAIDAEILRVGNGGGNYLDACSLEHIQHGKQRAALVFDEN